MKKKKEKLKKKPSISGTLGFSDNSGNVVDCFILILPFRNTLETCLHICSYLNCLNCSKTMLYKNTFLLNCNV